MQSTTLALLLEELDRSKDISNIEEQYKVKALDGAIRRLRRESVFPWTIKKGSLKVFNGVKEYPVASDHDEIIYLDPTNLEAYSQAARFFNTSVQQFYEDVMSNRNLLTELWDTGTPMIGVNYKDLALSSIELDSAEDSDNYTPTGDAISVSDDLVNYKEGNGSIRVVITSTTTVATIKCSFPVALSDSLYQSKYHFRWVYLDAVPTSIEMRLQTDDSNYLKTVVTAQFSGQAFKPDSWNLIAQNLDEATAVGTFDSGSIASEKIILNDAATGVYYLDTCNLREWKLFDYWYYSRYVVMADGSTSADQEKFWRSSNYNTADALIGDQEWIDVILYEAMEGLLVGINNVNLFSYVMRKKKEAWDTFGAKYPDMVPLVMTTRYRFDDEPIIKSL
jgi:hypothetical protein